MNDTQLADKVVQAQLESWGGERELFPLCLDDMKILISAGADRVVVNLDNHDGTFYNVVFYGERKFACSSCTRVH